MFPEKDLSLVKIRKQFYRAYELIYSKKFDPERYRKDKVIKKKHLKRICGNCPEYDTCKTPCPDVLAFVDQDRKTSTSEFIPGNEFWEVYNNER